MTWHFPPRIASGIRMVSSIFIQGSGRKLSDKSGLTEIQFKSTIISWQTIGLESTHLDRKAPNMFYPIKNIGIPSFLTTAIIRVVSGALFIILSIPLAQDSVMAVLPPEGLVPPTKVYQMTEIPKDSANVDEDLCGYKCCSIV
ncbi:hypothetical protein MJO28_011599 [Puccinia striiformis f. sp. tritici]|uniref:Uncharacterized protein n=1 Tax=Puccinia striiformis f. sp. tritici TaxID=168172 RepID=A0ACC0E3V6_9BASI|nr:hypothetical protein MJO28_011599 [Puccinia striiformis f. sp. tritici]KAI7946840.1 hypothetical protein MJO29_011367 [Puccinia striiformis f. sp. tritici]